MIKSISELEFGMQKRAKNAFDQMNSDYELKKLGCDEVVIIETRRELSTQMAYYSRGRMPIHDVKRMYDAAGLYTPTDEECKTEITWTLHSNHIRGKAIDIAPMQNDRIWWNAPEEVWERMGVIGESNGLKWGGRWDHKDCPHFEI